jgi:hypothetical protein
MVREVWHFWVQVDFVAGLALVHVRGAFKIARVQLNLVLEDRESMLGTGSHQVSNRLLDHASVVGNADDTVSLDDSVSERCELVVIVLVHFVHFTDFFDASKEFVSWTADVWLEIREPKNLRVQVWKTINNLGN